MPVTTTLMGLVVPSLNDPSPGYVTNLQNSFATLDAHDHSTGKGTPVPSAGMNINAALPFNGNSATTLRSTAFSNQSNQFSSAADTQSLYVFGNNLYFLNSSVAPIQLTAGSALAIPTTLNPTAINATNGTFTNLTVTGTLTAPGSKSTVGPFGYNASFGTLTAGSPTPLYYGPGSASFVSNTYPWVAPGPGSIVGLSARFGGGGSAGNIYTFAVWKNGGVTTMASSGTQTGTGSVNSTYFTAAVGTITFLANDLLYIAVNPSVSNTLNAVATFEVVLT